MHEPLPNVDRCEHCAEDQCTEGACNCTCIGCYDEATQTGPDSGELTDPEGFRAVDVGHQPLPADP